MESIVLSLARAGPLQHAGRQGRQGRQAGRRGAWLHSTAAQCTEMTCGGSQSFPEYWQAGPSCPERQQQEQQQQPVQPLTWSFSRSVDANHIAAAAMDELQKGEKLVKPARRRALVFSALPSGDLDRSEAGALDSREPACSTAATTEDQYQNPHSSQGTQLSLITRPLT